MRSQLTPSRLRLDLEKTPAGAGESTSAQPEPLSEQDSCATPTHKAPTALENEPIDEETAAEEEPKIRTVAEVGPLRIQREEQTTPDEREWNGLGKWLKDRRESMMPATSTIQAPMSHRLPPPIQAPMSHRLPAPDEGFLARLAAAEAIGPPGSSPDKGVVTDRSTAGELTARRSVAKPRMKPRGHG